MTVNSEEEIRERMQELDRLKTDEQFRREEAEALVHGLSVITNARTIETVFSATIDTLRSFIPVDSSGILKFDQAGGFSAIVSDPPDILTQPIAANPTLLRALDRGAVNVCNLAMAPGCEGLQLNGQYHSAVLFKLESPHFIGLLYLGNIEVGAFSQKHLKSLVNFTPLMNQTMQQIFYVEDLEAKVHSRTLELEQALENTELLANERARQLTNNEILASLGRTIQGIAHEFNTPVGICITSSSYIKQCQLAIANDLHSGVISKSRLKRYLGEVDNSVDLLTGNLQKVADFICNFKEIVVEQEFDDVRLFNVADYIVSIVDTKRAHFAEANIELKLNLDSDIKLSISPNALLQVLTHLLTNTLSHAFGLISESALLTVSLKQSKNFVTLEFNDNGKGIKKSLLDNIYEPFFTTSRFKGKHIGLGLHIVHKLVIEQLGGAIDCDAVENQYCRFVIKIPKGSINA